MNYYYSEIYALSDYMLEDELSSLNCEEDRKHWVYFDEISKKILNIIPKQNRPFIQKQLNVLNDNFLDYFGYWNEKYYINGFCDAFILFSSTLNT